VGVDELRRDEAVGALRDCYTAISRQVQAIGAALETTPTRCAGWTAADLLFHLLLDAQRALVAMAAPAEGDPDTDAVTYWEPWQPGSNRSVEHLRFVRRSAAAYRAPGGLVAQWDETSDAVVRLATWVPHELITTQGRLLTLPDFLETLVVEAALHLLDFALDTGPGAGTATGGGSLLRVPPQAEQILRFTLDGLLGMAPPSRWDLEGYALRADGRRPLTDSDRRALGWLADRFPLLG
jgi:hypothetical protein